MDYRVMTTEEILASNKYMRYVRTDRNGTRYFLDVQCPRCGGAGFIHCYGHVEGGRCFECGGAGVTHGSQVKVYTVEHEAKLEAQREARRAKKEEERKADFLANFTTKFGFGKEDNELVIYRVAGNTFPIKDMLKEMGAKFTPTIGWYFANMHELPDHTIQRLLVSQCADIDYDHCVVSWKEKDEVFPLLTETLTNPSKWQGEVGARLQRTLNIYKTFTGSGFRGGVSYLYLMKDADGNLYKWNTSNYYQEREYTFKFTVKEHSDYKGIQQTVITRATLVKE